MRPSRGPVISVRADGEESQVNVDGHAAFGVKIGAELCILLTFPPLTSTF
jgi:hypothetical protein